MKVTYNVQYAIKHSGIWKNSQHTNVAKTSRLNAQFATRISPDRRYCDNIWCSIKEAKGLDLNVTTVEELSDTAVI